MMFIGVERKLLWLGNKIVTKFEERYRENTSCEVFKERASEYTRKCISKGDLTVNE